MSSPLVTQCSTSFVHSLPLSQTRFVNCRRSPVQRRPRVHCPRRLVCTLSTQQDTRDKQHLLPKTEDIHLQSLHLLEWSEITSRVLRFASTPQGRRALAPTAHLRIPSTREQTEHLLGQTRAAYHLEYVLNRPLDFGGVRDIAEDVQIAAKGRLLTGRQLIDVANTLYSARRIRRHIDAIADTTGGNLDALSHLVSSFRTWPEVENEITRCLDDFGDVQESASSELRGIRMSLKDTLAEIRAKLNDIMAKNADAIQERVITSRYDRFVIPVKMARKAVFRRGIVHDASSTGSTAYIEPSSVKALNDRARQLAAKEKGVVNAVLRKLSSQFVGPIAGDVENLSYVLGDIDAAIARARCSRSLHAVDFVFDDDRPLMLLGVRHPLLSWKAMAETSDHAIDKNPSNESSQPVSFETDDPKWKTLVVPSSYLLGPDVRCVCVTGPNTGGKTLTLKTLGVSVLMAKAGLFVPASLPSEESVASTSIMQSTGYENQAEVARIPFFDSVLADIGDDQSLVQSLSTFSGHVKRIRKILAACTSKSLILLDEIGSGTDPAEGAALGMAILRDLAVNRSASLTFATTHHGELKTLKYAADDSARFFENASVEFDDVKMAPTYRLVWGIPGRSNALAIAERLGMSQEIIEEARFLLGGSDNESGGASARVDIEKMISSLERDTAAADLARKDSEMALRETRRMRAELDDRLQRLKGSEAKLRDEQKTVMDGEVKEAKKQIARVIKEMQKGGGSAQAAAKASERLQTMNLPGSPDKRASHSGQDSLVTSRDELKPGDRVIVPRISANEVEVVSLLNNKEIVVAIGVMKAKVKISEITQINQAQNKRYEVFDVPRGKQENERKQISVRTAANSIDIRGERVDAAEAKVDKAIDRALAMGTLWVIHGHGSGRLRNGIRSFLSQHNLVEHIEDADQNEGGTGVTVVYLS